MEELQFIKKMLEQDLEFWKNAEKKEEDPTLCIFYRGKVESLKTLKKEIDFVFKEKEEEECQID